MKLIAALTAFFKAAALFLELWQYWQERGILNDVTKIDHEIYRLSNDVNPSNLLQIESLRKQRKQLCSLQSTMRDHAGGADL